MDAQQYMQAAWQCWDTYNELMADTCTEPCPEVMLREAVVLAQMAQAQALVELVQGGGWMEKLAVNLAMLERPF